jgi:hypothetical protein
MSWWEKPKIESSAERTTPARRPGRSLYEERYKAQEGAERWESVGEIDPRTGEWKSLEAGWETRVGGWMPFDAFLEQRR